MNISRQSTRIGTMLGYTMLSLHKVLLTLLVSAVACITINTAHAEVASVYGGSDGFCGSRTANGERVNCSAMTAAHRTLPFGSRVTVCHHGCVVVRINDRGPFIPGRHIDLTPAAARAIGLDQIGQVSISR
jgi:rare lipoprotein A